MVPQIPRYGGGIKMYWNHKYLSDKIPQKQFVKMEEKAINDIQSKAFLREKEKNANGCLQHEMGDAEQQCLSSENFACQRETINQSRTSIFQECWRNTAAVAENQKQTLLRGEQNFTWRVSSSTMQTATESIINQSTVDHVLPYHDGESFTKNKASETVGRVWEKDNLPRLIDLMGFLKNLGVMAQPQLYTKLNHEEKEYWNVYLQNSRLAQVLSNESKTSQLFTSKPGNSSDDEDLVYCKNLFLKDRKGQFYLVITRESSTVDLKQLKQQLNASRNLSFSDEASLARILQLKPGEVTPFAIMFESAKDVRIVFHDSLSMIQQSDIPMAFHPFSPWLQIEIRFSELNLYIMHHGKQLEVLSQNESYTILKQQPKAPLKPQQLSQSNGAVTEKVTFKNRFSSIEQLSCHEETISACCAKDCPHRPDVYHSEETDSNYLLKGTVQGNNENDEIRDENVNNNLMETQCHKHTKSNIFKNSDRKGKLKSFIKKHTKQNKENLDNKNLSELGNTKDSRNKINKIKEASDILENEQNMTSLNGFSPMVPIPEIGDFYKCLTDCKINYSEINVSIATSNDFEPSLGVKCHLLKDKRQNFFLVVCHEFYELDYGRLKKALHPKKKLDECDASEMMEILGVDCQHLTPFAVMNVRARENQVNVFFTEKIIPANIILCIQHPFAQGSRILMSSSDLKSFLSKFSFNAVNMIEEKVWPKKYNRAFSQFDDADINQTNFPSQRFSHHDMKYSQCKGIVGKDIDTSEIIKSVAEDKDLEVQTDKSISLMNLYGNFKNLFLKCFSNNFLNCVLDDSSNSFFSYSKVVYKGWKHGSLVDKDNLIRKNRPRPDDNTMRSEKYLSEFENMKSEPQEYTINDGLSLIGRSHLQADRDIGPTEDAQSESKRNHDEVAKEDLIHSNLKFIYHETCKISIENIQRHLNENHVDYLIGNRYKKENHASLATIDDGSINVNDQISQICYTLHLVDESGKTHYLIVGGDSEHIPVKRFCRRFQVSKRLLTVNENDLSSLAAKRFPSTNPFSIFLSTCNVERLDATVKYNLVLYTSIFMDPDMECIFVLDQTGTSVCMSSEEFENYGKRVGMEVWYMP